MGKSCNRLGATEMIDMGMGENDEDGTVITLANLFDNLCQVCRLLCKPTRIDQQDHVAGLDQVGIRRDRVDLPDEGIQLCFRGTRHRLPDLGNGWFVTTRQALRPRKDRWKIWR